MTIHYDGLCLFFIHFYRPQRSWGKVMFLQVCVILFTGGVPDQVPPGTRYTPQPGTPPQTRYTPGTRYPPPPRTRYTPSPDQVPPWTRYPRDQVHPPWTRYPPGPGTPPQGPGTPPWDQVHPPRTRYPPGTRYTPLDQVHPRQTRYTPPRTRYTPPDQVPPRDQGDTVYARAVRILLECILVESVFESDEEFKIAIFFLQNKTWNYVYNFQEKLHSFSVSL